MKNGNRPLKNSSKSISNDELSREARPNEKDADYLTSYETVEVLKFLNPKYDPSISHLSVNGQLNSKPTPPF